MDRASPQTRSLRGFAHSGGRFLQFLEFIASDVGPIKATRRLRLVFSVGGKLCVAPTMQAVATSVASRFFHPDGFANNPSNPQTPLRGGSHLFTIAKGLQTVCGECSTAQTIAVRCRRRASPMQQNPTRFVCFSCCCSRIAIRAMKTTSTPAEVCVLGMPVFCFFFTFVAISNGSHP